MVQHAAGRAHHQLGPVTQGVHLLFVAHAAINGHGTDARAFEQGTRLVLHLHGQLAGGHQDQGLGGVQSGIQTRHQGQQVTAGLAAAGTGLHHDVAAFQQVRQGQGLHRHQGRPARTAAGSGDGFGQGLQRGTRQGVLGLGHGKILKGSAGGGKFGRRGGLFLRGLSGGGGAGRIGNVGHDGSLTHDGRGIPPAADANGLFFGYRKRTNLPQAASMRKAPPGLSRGGHGRGLRGLSDGGSRAGAPPLPGPGAHPAVFSGRGSTRRSPVRRGPAERHGARLLSPGRRQSVTGSGQAVKKGRLMRAPLASGQECG